MLTGHNFEIGSSLTKSIKRMVEGINNFNYQSIINSNLSNVIKKEQENLNRFSQEIELMFDDLDKEIGGLLESRFNDIIQRQIPSFDKELQKELKQLLEQQINNDVIQKLILSFIQMQISRIGNNGSIVNNRKLFFKR
ncbi:MAG: hypothetical protein MK137_09650 [Rickettsiales bacterium]|nr:hypothetical protein [Rickettsiales bacterium]